MTDDKAIEAALDAWNAPKVRGDTGYEDDSEGMRAALDAADKVRAAGKLPDIPDNAFICAFYDEHGNYIGDIGAKPFRALSTDAAFAAGLAKGEADRAALREAREPTEAMLNAARDWSIKKYGRGIGNDAAKGCWQVMLDAALSAASGGASGDDENEICHCPECGRAHRKMKFGKPPWAASRIAEPRMIPFNDDHAVCIGGRWDGWIFWKHPDGQWVSVRKPEPESRPTELLSSRPAPSETPNVDRARQIAEHAGIDLDDYDLFIAELAEALDSARAEGIAAMRECAAAIADRISTHPDPTWRQVAFLIANSIRGANP